MQLGKVECDNCKKYLAYIRASEQVFTVLIEEARFVSTLCSDCHKPDLKDEKQEINE